MTGTLKESFSGPSEIISAARRAATLKFGKSRGAWSRWLVEAAREKLSSERTDSPDLRAEAIAAIDEVGPERAAKILRRHARS